MEEILQLYSRKIEARQIRVIRRFRETSKITGYAGEIRQLFANLIVNAVEATARQGSLYVRVAPGHDWREGQEGVRVSVADNGSGIPSADLQRVFEPFFTTKKEYGHRLGIVGVERNCAQAWRFDSGAQPGGGAGARYCVFRFPSLSGQYQQGSVGAVFTIWPAVCSNTLLFNHLHSASVQCRNRDLRAWSGVRSPTYNE